MDFLKSMFRFEPSGGLGLRLQGPEDERQRRIDIAGTIEIESVKQATEMDLIFARALFSEPSELISSAKPRKSSFNRQDLFVSLSGGTIESSADPLVDIILKSVEVKLKSFDPASSEEGKAAIHVTLTADAEDLGYRDVGLIWERLDDTWSVIAREAVYQDAPPKTEAQREMERLEAAGQQCLLGGTMITLETPGRPPVRASADTFQHALDVLDGQKKKGKKS